MLRSCLLSREEISTMILKAPMTHDGYIFFPRFRVLNQLTGKIPDMGYYYDRSLFNNKIVIDSLDLKLYLAKEEVKFDESLKTMIDNKLTEVLKGYDKLSLNDIIPNTSYTLEELIDTTIYVINFKYSL